MKKIFAFVLATIMVLSLVPASAFAAITKADCSNGHKDPVKIGGQAATCQQSGYTIYKCNACGESYVADPVEKLEHNWVSDKTKAQYDIAASCLYGTTGKKHVVCGNKGCAASDVLVVHYNSVEAHSLKSVSGMGCETLWACKTCKAEGYKVPDTFEYDSDGDNVNETYKYVKLGDEAAHSWKFSKVTSEPSWGAGESKDGLALYECEAEDCPAVKSVVIACPECECDELVVVKPAVAQTCTTDGTLAVYQCVACSALWFDSNNDNDDTKVGENDLYLPAVSVDNPATDDDINDDGVITAEDAIIEKDGHKLPLATQVTQTGCVRSYTCEVCKVAVVETYHANVVPNVVLAPNCVRYGIRYDVCQLCGNQDTVYIPADGHDEAYITVPSNCAVAGGKFIVCNKGDACPLATTKFWNGTEAKVVACETAYALNTSAHAKIDQMTGTSAGSKANCFASAINVWTCANGCATYATPQVEYLAQVKHDLIKQVTVTNCKRGESGVLDTWTTMTFYQCKRSGCTYKEFDTTTKGPNAAFELEYKDIETTVTTTIQTTFADTAEMLEYHGVLRRGWKWNSSKSKVERDTSKDTYRSYSASTWLGEDATTCAFTRVTSLDKAATCLEAGYKVYRCTSCNMLAYVTQKKLDHNHDLPDGVTLDQLFIEGTEATCNTPGIRDSWKCYWCGVQYHNQMKLKDHAIVYDTQSTDLVIKPCGNYETLGVVENCKGSDYVECTICNTIYEKIDCKTKRDPNKNDHTWKYISEAIPATCGNDGSIEVRYCSTCNWIEANLVYEIDGEIKRVATKKNGNGKTWKQNGGNTFTFVKAEGLAYDDVVIKVGKGATTATFTYEKNVTSYSPVAVKMLNHTKLGTAVVGNAIVKDTTHASSAVLDHSEATFVKYQCSLCDYEIIDSYAPAAAGHINSDGQVLTVDCENANAISDRICVICYKAAADKDDATLYTIATGHNMVPATNKTSDDWDCTNAGFSYDVCTKCGAFEVGSTVVPADADAYHEKVLADLERLGKIVGGKPDYATEGSYYYQCPVCKVRLTETIEADCAGKGLEIYLSVNAKSYVPGSSVFVTVTLDSLLGVDLWAVRFPVNYNKEVFEFVGYEFNTAESEFQTFVVNEAPAGYKFEAVQGSDNMFVSTGKFLNSGILNVIANAGDEVTVKGDEVLCVLEFKVIGTAAASEKFEVKPATITSGGTLGNKLNVQDDGYLASMYPGYYWFDPSTAVPMSFPVEAVSGNGSKVEVNANKKNSAKAKVQALFDLDGTAGLTLADAHAVYALIYNNEYDARADVDFDGKVTAMDLTVLYSILTGKTTIDSVLAVEADPDTNLPPEGTIMPR